MRFVCNKDNLESAISIVQKAVKTNSTLPILDGIHIQAEGQSVKLTGYDLETGIEADVASDVSDNGAVVVNSRIFGEIIKNLPENTVEIKSDDRNFISIVSGRKIIESIEKAME